MSAFLYQNPNYRQNNNIIGWSMKFIKKHINLVIVGLVILIACGVAFGIAMSGMKNGDYHYVAINTQADVEMILDKKHNVIATYPQNEKAKILLSNCDIIGSKVEDAVVSVLEQSCMLNFIDVDATEEGNNAVKMTVVSGLTNALELNVYRTINNFMLDNGIFCVIIENETDHTLLKQARKESLSPDKYSLITSILDKSDWTFEKLKSKSEQDLLDIMYYIDKDYLLEDYSTQKQNLLDKYQAKYEEHINNLTNDYLRQFGSKYNVFSKTRTKEFKLNFPY